MAWYEKLLKEGGVAVAAIGLAGVVVTGTITYYGNERTEGNHRTEIQAKYDLERQKIRLQEKTMICGETFKVLGDESPNKDLDAEERAAAKATLQRNLRECTIGRLSDRPFGDKS